MMRQDEAIQPKATSGDEVVEELFNEEAAEDGHDWVQVIGSEEMPTVFSQQQSSSKCILTTPIQENNQENHRLATGTGPIEVASANLCLKISDLGTAAAAKASRAPTVMRTCAENQVERLAEGVGRVTVSDTVSAALQRYPLLERWRLAFFRGRARDGRRSLLSLRLSKREQAARRSCTWPKNYLLAWERRRWRMCRLGRSRERGRTIGRRLYSFALAFGRWLGIHLLAD
jgi:hypothetical protein